MHIFVPTLSEDFPKTEVKVCYLVMILFGIEKRFSVSFLGDIGFSFPLVFLLRVITPIRLENQR